MTCGRQISILRDSWNLVNKFTMNNSNSLVHEEIKDGELLSKKEIAYNIKDYSASIDSEDKIHIIFIDIGYQLKYMVLPEYDNIVNIVSVRKGLVLRCISIKMLLTVPHIFYVLTDVTYNSHIICHGFYYCGYWQVNEIFESIGPKLIVPYFIQLHNSDIYILIYSNHYDGKLELCRLDNSNGNWVDMDKSIEIKEGSNVCFFISPSNTAIIAYNKLMYKNIQTIIMHRNLLEKKQVVWEKSILSDKNINTLKPSIFFKSEDYYMTWEQGNEILLKRSKDLKLWEDVITFNKNFDLKIDSTSLSKVIIEKPSINIKPVNKPPKEFLLLESGQFNVDLLEEKILYLGEKLERNTRENNLMKNNIVYLNSLIGQFEENIIELNKRWISSHQDKNSFLSRMLSFNKGNDMLLLSNNNKLWELFNLIQKKDKLINDLYMKINK